MSYRFLFCVVFGTAAMQSTGCGGSTYLYTSTATSPRPVPPREANCLFQVTTKQPDSGFEEIGVLERNDSIRAIVKPDQWATYGAATITKFRVATAEQVCHAGGDLVIAEINGGGIYVRGVVFHKQPRPSEGQAQ